MSKKIGLKIKKDIIRELSKEPLSLRKLETKLRTNYNTIRDHCEELEYLGVIEITKHKRNPQNNRPYTTAELTEQGKRLIKTSKN